MRILAIETALETASAAVWEGDGEPEAAAISEAACSERAAASRDLLPAIDGLLSERRWSLADLDGVALTVGPGSFTGLRIGVSLVKGLAATHPLRIAALGSLDAVALASGRSGCVAAMLDARRGEVYARLFRCGDGGVEPLNDETVAAPEAWVASLSVDGTLWCVGSGAARHADSLQGALGSRVAVAHETVTTPAAATLRLGVRRLITGQDTPLGELLPRYLRRSNAETSLEQGLVGSRRRRVLGWDPAHGHG
jgi:tRNA threonylcarbamoyladenosine biosynthesis protein TsaB